LERRGRKVKLVEVEPAGEGASSSNSEEGGAFRAGSGDGSHAGVDVIVLAYADSSRGESWESLRHAPRPLINIEVREGLQDAAGGESVARAGAEIMGGPPPEATLQADANTPEQSVAHILSELEALNLIAAPAQPTEAYDADDEEIIRRRLESMGYL
jgi:hypothetical protein